MVFAARNRVGVAIALLGPLAMLTFGPAPAYAAATAPTVALTGQLIQLADQAGPPVAAVRTADRQLVPVAASVVKNLKPGSAVTLNVVVPAAVRSVAAANRTLTVRGPNGRTTSTSLDTQDLAAASDGTPEPATSDLGRATVASAVSTGQALAVSAVISTADPVSSVTPAPRHLFVAIVTPQGWPTPNAVTPDQIQTQVAGASNYWSTVSGGAVTMDIAAISATYTSVYNCDDPWGMWTDAATKTGFKGDPNTSLVLELPPGIPACSYGLGTIGANVNDFGALYVSDDVFPVLAHELGHNMSLKHADTLLCPSASDSAYEGWNGSVCTEASYGDGDDVMSASPRTFAPFLSSPQSLRTGLIPASAATVISSNSASTVILNALGSRAGVRTAQVVDPTNGVTYYVEYRVAATPDTVNVYGDAVGVRVLRFNPVDGATVLLDPTPTGTTSDTDATLHVGSTFTSYSGAVRVTTVSSTPTTATVTINSGVGAPTAPLVAITGNPAALTASATASFSFAGFDTTDAASSLRYLCSRDGATASACTSPVTYTALTSAVHTFTVKVLNLTGNSASATYSWRVDRVAPTLTMTAPATGYALTTSLTPAWSAKDVGGGVANVDLRWARAAYNGGFTSAVYPSTWQKTTATKATLSGAAPGYTYCFSARARDKAGNLSAWSAPRCSGVALDDRSLTVSTGWSRVTSSVFYRATATVTSRSAVTLTRTGVQTKRIYLVATRCSTCGTVGVYWNGTLIKKVSLYASTTTRRSVFGITTFTGVRSGTLTIRTLTINKAVQIDGVALVRG